MPTGTIFWTDLPYSPVLVQHREFALKSIMASFTDGRRVDWMKPVLACVQSVACETSLEATLNFVSIGFSPKTCARGVQ
jgi:hypothetical protein